jgi:hypothetical protein
MAVDNTSNTSTNGRLYVAWWQSKGPYYNRTEYIKFALSTSCGENWSEIDSTDFLDIAVVNGHRKVHQFRSLKSAPPESAFFVVHDSFSLLS